MAGEPKQCCLKVRNPGVLVVEEEAAIRTLLDTALSKRGFTVLLAADGPQAVEVYRRRHADIEVVLLDVGMADLDGPETLAALRTIDPGVRCCFMSGGLSRYSEKEFAESGCFFLPKPFSTQEVGDALWHAVDGSRPRAPLSVRGESLSRE